MKKKKVAITNLALAAVACCGVGTAFLLQSVEAKADDLFNETTGVTCEYNYTAESGAKGVRLSTEQSSATVDFKNTYEGAFELTFLPLATEDDAVNFMAFNVDFQPTEGGNYFRFAYKVSSAQATMSCLWGETPMNNTSVSIYSLSEKVTVGFDSETMTMYYRLGTANSVVLADFHDSAKMASTLSTHNTVKDSGAYNVAVSFSGTTAGKSASVLLCDINGQGLSGSPIVNNKGANVVRADLYAGVVNKPFTIDTSKVLACDALDGVMPFNGKVSVKDPEGANVTLDDNKFTPTQTGTYTVTFRAKDVDGILGAEKSFGVNVYSRHTTSQMQFAFPINNASIGANTDVLLPAATAYNSLFGGKLPVAVSVKKGSETVYESADMAASKMLTLTENGTYTVTYTATDSIGEEVTKTATITVADGYSLRLESGLDEIYFAENYFVVPSISTNATKSSFKLFMPDGRVSTSKRVMLTALGTYTLRYYLGENGETTVDYGFNVKTRASELFETTKDMKVENDSTVPDYMDAKVEGAMLSASLINATATYKNVIDLTGRTKNDLLAEMYVTPEERLNLELGKFSVRLTDAYDESNYVAMTFAVERWSTYMNNCEASATVGEAAYPKYDLIGSSLHGKYKEYNDIYSHYGLTFSSTIRIYWDDEEKAFYADSSGSRTLIADLDNREMMGANAFKGFTTGEVKLSIVFDDPRMTGHVLVQEIAGLKMDGAYVEERTAPTVAVQWLGETPFGCVNKAYPIFDAYGLDNVDGRLGTSVAVYMQKGAAKERILVKDGKFVPTQAGVYELVYKTTNSAGKVAQKTVYVTVKEESNLEALSMSVDAYAATATQGEYLEIGTAEVTGGSGYTTVKTTVFVGSEKVAEYTNRGGNVFLNKAGTYTIKYVAEDVYAGLVKEYTATVTVTAPTKPVFEALSMPTAFIWQKTYTLPTATAYDYSSGTREFATVKVYVDGAEKTMGESITFDRPFASTYTANIVYKATNADGSTEQLTFEVPVVNVDSKSKPIYLSRYFLYDDSVTVEAESLSLTFISTGDEQVKFINTIPAQLFSINFSVAEEFANMNAVQIILTDSVNPAEKIVLNIAKLATSASSSALTINGVDCNTVAGAIGGSGMNGTFALSIEGNYLKDGAGNAVALVNADGSAFGGFTSGLVSLEMRTVGTPSNQQSAITLSSIVNQTFGSTSSDRGKPNVWLKEDMPLFAEYGTTLTLPKAQAYDVLDPEVQFYVSVSLGGETILEKTKYTEGLSFKLNKYGKYNVLFYAEDSSGRSLEAPYVLRVYDRQPPEITLSAGYLKTASVGEAVTLAQAQTTSTATLEVLVSQPNGQIVFAANGGEFTPDRTGTYRVMYYAYNSDGAVNVVTYEIVVK